MGVRAALAARLSTPIQRPIAAPHLFGAVHQNGRKIMVTPAMILRCLNAGQHLACGIQHQLAVRAQGVDGEITRVGASVTKHKITLQVGHKRQAGGVEQIQGTNHRAGNVGGNGGGEFLGVLRGYGGGVGVDKQSGFVQRTVLDSHLIIIIGDQMLGQFGAHATGSIFMSPSVPDIFKQRVACDVQLTTPQRKRLAEPLGQLCGQTHILYASLRYDS